MVVPICMWACTKFGNIHRRGHKFFVTGAKDLSTGVKYMDSKVNYWFYSCRCQGSEYRCQVYGFQSGFLVYSYGGGGGFKGAKCVEVLCIERGGTKCVEVLCVEIFTNSQKFLMTFYINISKTV